MAQLLIALLAGAIFGIGLVISDLTNPERVIRFLDLAGDWDPTLLVVVGAAVSVAGIGGVVARRRARPVFAPRFALPMTELLDARLIGGALLFGVGWGLSGYCPAPALTGAVLFHPKTLLFVGAMLAGMLLFSWREARIVARAAQSSGAADSR